MLRILTCCGIKHEKYLDSCKDSVKQIPHPHEHLVATGDETKAVLMNRLLKQVNDDDIVIVLDADDVFIGNPSKSIRKLDTRDLVYRDVVNMDEDGSEVYVKSRPFDKELFKKKNFIPYSGVAMKGWLAKSEPYPDLVHGNDWNFWWSLRQHSTDWTYVQGTFVRRRTWTSHKRCDIPVYRKLRRLWREYLVKKENSKYYEGK